MAARPVHTYSIVARDPETGQLGAAVQSHYFCVGAGVIWAEAGVGAVATQSFADPAYGPLGLTLMRAGKSPQDTLNGLLTADTHAASRQVAMVDAAGEVAVHTGAKSIADAGHRTGKGYSCQANLMRNATIWDAMAEAYEGAKGDLAERLMIALEAAEEAGGDIRGKQSAALLVVSGELTMSPWQGRIFDLRVDDHPTPLPELRRLLSISRAYKHEDAGEALLMDRALGEDRVQKSIEEFDKAMELMPLSMGNPEIAFWRAVAFSSAGHLDDALPYFRQVFAIDPSFRDLVPRMVDAGLMPDDKEMIARITGL